MRILIILLLFCGVASADDYVCYTDTGPVSNAVIEVIISEVLIPVPDNCIEVTRAVAEIVREDFRHYKVVGRDVIEMTVSEKALIDAPSQEEKDYDDAQNSARTKLRDLGFTDSEIDIILAGM